MKNILVIATICIALTLGVSGQDEDLFIARQGDTVQTLAVRHHLDPLELAKYNGLLPNSPLSAGRELKRPVPRCDLGLNEAPTIRGLKLGMDEKEVETVLGEKLRYHFNEADRTSSTAAAATGKIGFEGIQYVYFDTYNSRVYKMRITYDISWKSINEFVENFSPKLGLPLNAWKPSLMGAIMPCKEFEIELSSHGSSGLELTDMIAVSKIKDEREKAIDAKKKAIKP